MKLQTKLSPIQMLNKVPQVSIYFWIIKIMATTVGETAADFYHLITLWPHYYIYFDGYFADTCITNTIALQAISAFTLLDSSGVN